MLAALGAAGAALALAPAEALAADVTAQVNHQRLLVVSRGADARITLRLRAGQPTQLVVDADSDGDAEFRFDRTRFDRILVSARGGNDVVRIVERHGLFTTAERTTIHGGPGTDSIAGGSGSETLIGGPDADSISGGPGPDHVSLGPADDLFRTTTGDGRDVLEGQTEPTRSG